MRLILLGLALFVYNEAQAGLAVSSSRIIYEEGSNNKSFIIANINEYPIIVQSWVDNGEGDPAYTNTPFVIVPPVFKMEPNVNHTVRVIYNGDELPQDRESVYWVNLYEIPGKKKTLKTEPSAKDASLDIAMNTQFKIFYRPKSLKDFDIRYINKYIKFSVKERDGKKYLFCHNMSPYNLSFSTLKVVTTTNTTEVVSTMDMMTKALSDKSYTLPETFDGDSPVAVQYSLINDNGRIEQNIFKF